MADHTHEQTTPAHKTKTADEALKDLKDGNKNFLGENLTNLTTQAKQKRLQEVAEKDSEGKPHQYPFAIILSCADSRVPPEIIFNCGLGDLFVVRVAGNVCDSFALGSIEYAVEHLDVPLVVVLGHKWCGAVSAALDSLKPGGKMPGGQVDSLVRAIVPAIEQTNLPSLDVAVKDNAKQVANHLSGYFAELVAHDKVKIMSAVYDLDTGAVDFSTDSHNFVKAFVEPFVQWLNGKRQQSSLSPLTLDYQLTAAAQAFSAYMAQRGWAWQDTEARWVESIREAGYKEPNKTGAINFAIPEGTNRMPFMDSFLNDKAWKGVFTGEYTKVGVGLTGGYGRIYVSKP